jgi:outer membrane lipoprotein SlyB
MNSHQEKTAKNTQKSVANEIIQQQTATPVFQFEDNRPEAVAQLKMKAQLEAISSENPIQQKKNTTGLPDKLKSGIENISGYSMDDVKVHYNSSKPAQLNAHAYAQGSNIHIASGQEKHLPHEAWHVVQQKQGRVQPTKQLKQKVNINDDVGLEKEADVMGAKAMQLKAENTTSLDLKTVTNEKTTQLNKKGENIGASVGVLGGAVVGGKAGYSIGALVGLALAGPAGAVLGILGGTIVGYKAGKSIGHWITGRNNHSDLPLEDQGLDNLRVDHLPAGTSLYHGTRWKKGEPQWWKTDIPNSIDKDDGGVAFTRDPSSTPKVRNASIIIQYVLKQNINVIRCKKKGEFRPLLMANSDAVVYAPAEQEVRFNLGYARQVLQYKDEFNGRSRKEADSMV